MPSWVTIKLIGIAVVVLVILGLLTKIYLSGREAGKEVIRQEVQHQREKIEKSWKKIDRKPIAVDDAVKRLRKRSNEAGYSSDARGSSPGSDNSLGEYLY